MGEIVNLKRARKTKARAKKDEQAAGNRARFGIPKVLREAETARSEKAVRDLEAVKLDPDKPLAE